MRILKGVKVLDLSRLLPGPYCSMLLADLGCEVIKVEDPDVGDYGRDYYPGMFQAVNRNKKSIALNLKEEQDRRSFYKLCEEADVIIESFRPGVAQRLNIDYSTIKEINPKIVYCSLSGYGQYGPYKDLPGHDLNYLGITGMFAVSGQPEDPPRETTIFPVADLSNSLFGAISILSALFSVKVHNREGVHIDLSLVDSVTALMAINTVEYLSRGKPSKEQMMKRAAYDVFETKDGKYISLGCIEDKFFFNLCQALRLEHLANDPRFATASGRDQYYKEINDSIGNVLIQREFNDWFEYLARRDIPCAPVYDTIDQIFEDEHLKSRGIFDFMNAAKDSIPHFLFPAKFSGATLKVNSPAPTLGQHTDEILGKR